jgi:hypothetical protein
VLRVPATVIPEGVLWKIGINELFNVERKNFAGIAGREDDTIVRASGTFGRRRLSHKATFSIKNSELSALSLAD